jgi:hypothetical protein
MTLRAELLPCGTRFALIGARWRDEYPVDALPRQRALYAKLASLPGRAERYGPTVASLDGVAADLAQRGAS